MSIANGQIPGWILNLLVPGLGHWYWKEYAFGLFTYLITLLATVLFVASFFITIPAPLELLMFALPIVFYAFTFVDVSRTSRLKRKTTRRSDRSLLILVICGLGYQVFAPVAPLNFIIRNRPEVFVQPNNDLSPRFSKGDLLKASRLSYLVTVFAVDRPILHTLPRRSDVVRFKTDDGRRLSGIVVGLPGEHVEITEGTVYADGIPDLTAASTHLRLEGHLPLTAVDDYDILVVTLNLGAVNSVYHVPLVHLIGKVENMF